ncbi:hypothetical protein RND71_020822 [Anisodus tanguticus]|uniref:Uncharacterized protein n=1 Tax=Anisodus tanguticus TaxID=243964 RepID=A0AAE1RX23_9SOLA|nr:hypothetical protein RND71_020822 [Anisodus tanguticus]
MSFSTLEKVMLSKLRESTGMMYLKLLCDNAGSSVRQPKSICPITFIYGLKFIVTNLYNMARLDITEGPINSTKSLFYGLLLLGHISGIFSFISIGRHQVLSKICVDDSFNANPDLVESGLMQIPSDMTVNAMIVAMTAHSDQRGSETIYQIGSSVSNPLEVWDSKLSTQHVVNIFKANTRSSTGKSNPFAIVKFYGKMSSERRENIRRTQIHNSEELNHSNEEDEENLNSIQFVRESSSDTMLKVDRKEHINIEEEHLNIEEEDGGKYVDREVEPGSCKLRPSGMATSYIPSHQPKPPTTHQSSSIRIDHGICDQEHPLLSHSQLKTPLFRPETSPMDCSTTIKPHTNRVHSSVHSSDLHGGFSYGRTDPRIHQVQQQGTRGHDDLHEGP